MLTHTENNAETNLNAAMLVASQDNNSVFTTLKVHPIFQNHYVNLDSGKHGFIAIVSEILTENAAVFHKGIENTPKRAAAVQQAMFIEDIFNAIQAKFTAGTSRHSYASCHTFLSKWMFEKGIIGKIKLSNAEDKNRSCCKPRTKIYLVSKTETVEVPLA